MFRCLKTVTACVAVAVPLLAGAQTFVRPIPLQTLRGELSFEKPPQVLLNGQPATLAPGVRIRDFDNRLVLPTAFTGHKLPVNYTRDPYGFVMEVWLLTEEEAARPWPHTPKEAATWAYDPVKHTWAKP